MYRARNQTWSSMKPLRATTPTEHLHRHATTILTGTRSVMTAQTQVFITRSRTGICLHPRRASRLGIKGHGTNQIGDKHDGGNPTRNPTHHGNQHQHGNNITATRTMQHGIPVTGRQATTIDATNNATIETIKFHIELGAPTLTLENAERICSMGSALAMCRARLCSYHAGKLRVLTVVTT